MLTLNGPDCRLELEVLGYEFPSASAPFDGLDSEWLIIAGKAQSARGRWKFRDPCLTTFELRRLASWLRDVPAGGRDREIGFMEPNLRFEQVKEPSGDVLYVYLSQEAAPPGVTDEERYGNGYAMRIPFSSIDFAAAAAAIEDVCRKFPVRAK